MHPLSKNVVRQQLKVCQFR